MVRTLFLIVSGIFTVVYCIWATRGMVDNDRREFGKVRKD